MHVEWDIHKKLMSRGLNPHLKKTSEGSEGFNMSSEQKFNVMYFNFGSHEKILKFDIFRNIIENLSFSHIRLC